MKTVTRTETECHRTETLQEDRHPSQPSPLFQTHRGSDSDAPNEIWVSDITYVHTGEAVCNLPLITDLRDGTAASRVGISMTQSGDFLGIAMAERANRMDIQSTA